MKQIKMKHNIYRISIKLIGVYLIITSINRILHELGMLLIDYRNLVWYVPIIAAHFLLIYLYYQFLLNPDQLIKKLKLDHEKEEEEQAFLKSLKSVTVLRIGLILISVLTFLNQLAPFLTNLFLIFKKSMGIDTEVNNMYNSDVFFINYNHFYGAIVLMIGSALTIMYSARISKWLYQLGNESDFDEDIDDRVCGSVDKDQFS